MNVFEMMLFHMVFLFFPLLIYLMYVAYHKNIERKENDLFFEFALVSSLYFVIKYGQLDASRLPILLVNLPLIIAYIKRRNLGILLVSVGLIQYYHLFFGYSVVWLLLEYVLYYVIYWVFFKKKMDDYYFIGIFIVIKLIIFTLFLWGDHYFYGISSVELTEYMIVCVSFFVLIFISIFLLQKGEDILSLYMTLKELEKEKQVHNSLFQITHEIKNPIAVCKGYLDMFDVNNVEHSRKFVPIMKEEIDRTLILLQDFLSLNKIKIESDILDIEYLLEETVRSLQPLFKEKKIMLVTHFLDDEFYMMGDYHRLKQVLVNLLKNSIEAMERAEHKVLTVETTLVDKEFSIWIHDTGEGISEENLKKLKQPFFSTKVKGTGLGVYLSNEIVKAHHGSLNYYSKDQEGTTVILTISLIEE